MGKEIGKITRKLSHPNNTDRYGASYIVGGVGLLCDRTLMLVLGVEMGSDPMSRPTYFAYLADWG